MRAQSLSTPCEERTGRIPVFLNVSYDIIRCAPPRYGWSSLSRRGAQTGCNGEVFFMIKCEGCQREGLTEHPDFVGLCFGCAPRLGLASDEHTREKQAEELGQASGIPVGAIEFPDGDVCKACNQPQKYMHVYTPGYCLECVSTGKANRHITGTTTYDETRRRYNRLKKYGLTIERENELDMRAQGRCMICHKTQLEAIGRNIELCVDHCTFGVRGFLCTLCNTGLGYFKDHPELMVAAAEYLQVAHAELGVTTT